MHNRNNATAGRNALRRKPPPGSPAQRSWRRHRSREENISNAFRNLRGMPCDAQQTGTRIATYRSFSPFCQEIAMSKHDSLLRFAVPAAIALAGLGSATASADNHEGMEQCAGIIKAGKNDCATSSNACHGHVTVDSNPEAWIYVPQGTCDRLVGGRVVEVTDPTPASKK
jgi:uncharacterized membrane protein